MGPPPCKVGGLSIQVQSTGFSNQHKTLTAPWQQQGKEQSRFKRRNVAQLGANVYSTQVIGQMADGKPVATLPLVRGSRSQRPLCLESALQRRSVRQRGCNRGSAFIHIQGQPISAFIHSVPLTHEAGAGETVLTVKADRQVRAEDPSPASQHLSPQPGSLLVSSSIATRGSVVNITVPQCAMYPTCRQSQCNCCCCP